MDKCQLGHVCAGYKPCNITPYMHIMAYHVPYFIKKYTIKQYSCQGTVAITIFTYISLYMVANSHVYVATYVWQDCYIAVVKK